MQQQRMQDKQFNQAVEMAKATKGQNKAIEAGSPLGLLTGTVKEQAA
jgi:hypothetical protein